MRKKGEIQWIIINAILIIIILGLSIFFIFNEYWGENEINWEVCRQSVILRNSVPNYALISDAKELLPLKCEMGVLEIDYKDVEKAEKQISDAIAECKHLYEGEGNEKYSLYPPTILQKDKYCSPCVRIHFSEDVREFYKLENINNELAIGPNDLFVLGYMEETKFINTGKSYSKYVWGGFPIARPSGLKLPEKDCLSNCEDYGVRPYIDPYYDTIIANYFWTGTTKVNNLYNLIFFNEIKGYGSITFYYQPDLDKADCKWEGVLA